MTVDFAPDPALFTALTRYLASDPELKGPAVLRRALRAYLAKEGYYDQSASIGDSTHAVVDGELVRVKKK